MNQIEIEFLCDLSTFPAEWVTLDITEGAAEKANSRLTQRILNPPGWSCSIPRPGPWPEVITFRERTVERGDSRRPARLVDRADPGEPLERTAVFGAALPTAFNDNALITYLATLVPNLPDALKIAVVEGAVTGGGLTVIANAPNPAGRALLSRFFDGAISPVGLLLGALIPTLVAVIAFWVL